MRARETLKQRKRTDKVLRLHAKGLKNYEIAELVGTSLATVNRDMKAGTERIKKELKLKGELPMPVLEALIRMKTVLENANRELNALQAETKNDSVKLGTINSSIEVVVKEMRLLEKFGIADFSPEKLQLIGEFAEMPAIMTAVHKALEKREEK